MHPPLFHGNCIIPAEGREVKAVSRRDLELSASEGGYRAVALLDL